MVLYIDTSNSEKIIIKLDEKEITREATREKSQLLLSVINDELTKMGKLISDLNSIEVVTGPGSYTGLRVGISVANTLGWSLGIPVNGSDKLVEPNY